MLYDFFMIKLFKVFCLLLALISFSGCLPTTNQGWIDHYNSQSASKLCFEYYRFGDDRRRIAIVNRGLDCSPWKAAGLAKRKRDEKWIAIGDAGKAMSNTIDNALSNTNTGSSTYSGLTKVCRYKGTGGYSALVVPATSICPLTHSSNISGFTKVCNYPNAIGGPKAITVSSTAICPLSYN
jgi:hypothetical protein